MKIISVTTVVFIIVFACNANATIIIMDEHVDQQASLTVLGTAYTTSYSGRVNGVNPISRQNISLLFSENAAGDEVFSGISTNLNAPNGEAFSYGFAWSQCFHNSYNFSLNSDQWWLSAGDVPEAVEALDSISQNSFIDFDVRFRVDGTEDALQVQEIVEDGRFGTVGFSLRDHTAGFGSNVDFQYELEDGHVYTLSALLTNTTYAEHTVEGDVFFTGDITYVPEPSSLLLFSAGLFGLIGIRRKRKE